MSSRTPGYARRVSFLLAVVAALSGCNGGDEDGPTPPAYTLADLAGRWRYTALYAGPSVATGATPGWIRGTLSVDANGVVALETYADSAGSPMPQLPTTTYAITDEGVVTATTTAFTATHGKMNPAKNLFVTTATQGAGPATRMRLSFYEKVVPGVTYGAADVASATFSLHQLAAGAIAGWMHAGIVVDADGVHSVRDIVTQDGPQPDVPDQGTLSISADGVVTTTVAPTFAGFLSADKQLLIGTQTNAANEHVLSVLVRSGGAFATADLAGKWSYSNLASAVGAGAWVHGTVTFDAAGTGTFGTQSDSSGGSEVPSPLALAVAADGTVTTVPAAAFHGTLTPAKDLMVATETHESGVYGMIVAVR